MNTRQAIFRVVVVILITPWLAAQTAPAAQELLLHLNPAKSGADITLTGNFHAVEGSFLSKRGAIHYDPATGKASGEIVFDATSGHTGNDSRDHKMHKDVLHSQRYPEIAFHPDRAEGTLATSGESTLQVHGQFAIHGAEHEITIPVRMDVQGNTWTAKASFTVPYTKWGMKNPSKLFLRVSNEVKVQFHASGSLAK
jgi:polyisoprenoid-binding protein YceI